MRLAVGSANPVKCDAVRDVYKAFFEVEASVVSVNIGSGVSPQPFNAEIPCGARTRAEQALAATDADWGVGIEAGVVRQRGDLPPVAIQVAAIVDRDGRVTWGMSPGFELPNCIAARLATGETLAGAMTAVYGPSFDPEKGAIATLSGGRIDRADLTRSTVQMALVPRLTDCGDKRLSRCYDDCESAGPP
ncbi:DUF84 family protein [Candidatus Bipolaricaulota bacterium]|nr:DUF84 family protein [Candidatus Bipolaricaulota bacterium]